MTLCTNLQNGQGSPVNTSKKEVVDRNGRDSGIPQYKITTINCHVAPLYQDNPFIKSTFTRYTNWSFTDSLESYQNRAWKETMILRRNNRVPTKEFVLHFLKVLSAKDISTYRTKIFRVLTDNGFEAVAGIELTKDGNGKPNNSVHFHVLTDAQRSESELRKLFETACERQGLVKGKDFRITYRVLDDGYGYFDYFTKYGKHSRDVILFVKGTGLDKFYQIGKWFGKSKKQIWKEYIRDRYGSAPVKMIHSALAQNSYPRPLTEAQRELLEPLRVWRSVFCYFVSSPACSLSCYHLWGWWRLIWSW